MLQSFRVWGFGAYSGVRVRGIGLSLRPMFGAHTPSNPRGIRKFDESRNLTPHLHDLMNDLIGAPSP